MLMKSPTGGTGLGGGVSREVIFRLTVQPDPNAPRTTKEFADDFVRAQNRMAGTAQMRAKEITDFYRTAFDEILRHGSSVFDQLAAKSRAVMGGFPSAGGIAGGGSAPMARGNVGPGGMNMSALAASAGNWTNLVGSPGGGPAAHGIGGGHAGHGGHHGFFGQSGAALAGQHLFHGGMQLARGAALVGMGDEMDSQKVLESLLRMEGLLGLIHGAVAIGRGFSHLTPTTGAGLAAIGAIGYAAAGIGGLAYDEMDLRNGKNYGHKTQEIPWYLQGAQLYGWKGDKGEPAETWRGFRESGERVGKQEKYLEGRKKADEASLGELAGMSAEHDYNSAKRWSGSRPDARAGNIAKDIEEQSALYKAALDKEEDAKKRQNTKLQEFTRARIAEELKLDEQLVKQRDHLEQQARIVRDLSMNRAQNTAGIASARLSEQGGLAMSAAGRLRSDQAKLGSLSPLERMRTEQAFLAVKMGNATMEQEQIAGGYNAFGDKIEAANAKRGQSPFFADLAKGAATAATEYQKQAAVVAQANLNVITEHVLTIKAAKDRGEDTELAKQALEFIREMFDKKDRDLTQKFDDLRRELNGQQRNRQVIAGR